MHISEGVLDPSLLAIGGVLAVAGCAQGLRRLDETRIVPVALLSAAFFTSAQLRVPLGLGVSAHLLFNGLAGVILGWAAFPALAVALLLQALLFQCGGLSAWGVNTVNMALPAVLIGYAVRPWLARQTWVRQVAAFFCGVFSVLGAALLTALSLFFTDASFAASSASLLLAHIPVALVEGLVTVAIVSFLAKVRPELLPPPQEGQ